MKFSTKINIPKSETSINHHSKVLLLGSCFTENMGDKFDFFKFQNLTNPFGIVFNPVSIENLVFRALTDDEFTEKDIFFHDGLWKCFAVHSDLNNCNKVDFLNQLNTTLNRFKDNLLSTTHFILTLGTAWVYRTIADEKIVSNCHKVPQNKFVKELLSIDILKKSLQNVMDLVLNNNPSCTFIFTISPVRHLKDGFIENTISKAHLISAVHQLKCANTNYFPSYEILIDELRDYRFYADDLLHPSKMAIEYIWKRFTETYFFDQTIAICNEVEAIQKALLHRPLNGNSENHLKFLLHLNEKIKNFSLQNPHIKF